MFEGLILSCVAEYYPGQPTKSEGRTDTVELSLEEEELTIYIKERGSRISNLKENAGQWGMLGRKYTQ